MIILGFLYSKAQHFILILLALNIACVGTVSASEIKKHTLAYDKRSRDYLLYRPESLSDNTPVPLVIMLHGGFGSGDQAEKSYNWDAQADKQGFVVAYPDGIKKTWNAGSCCGGAARKNVDDLGFLTKLIETIYKSENIDANRIYLTGMSNGAAMSYRYACEGSYPIAAIGAVAGSFSFACPNPHKISVMAINGLEDRHVPFLGGVGEKSFAKVSWLPVQQAIDSFINANKCTSKTSTKTGVVQTDISHCPQSREVALITIENAGHQWPSGKTNKGFVSRILFNPDPPSTALDATATLWDFFQNHPLQNNIVQP